MASLKFLLCFESRNGPLNCFQGGGLSWTPNDFPSRTADLTPLCLCAREGECDWPRSQRRAETRHLIDWSDCNKEKSDLCSRKLITSSELRTGGRRVFGKSDSFSRRLTEGIRQKPSDKEQSEVLVHQQGKPNGAPPDRHLTVTLPENIKRN
jgi:hypothetical protein